MPRGGGSISPDVGNKKGIISNKLLNNKNLLEVSLAQIKIFFKN